MAIKFDRRQVLRGAAAGAAGAALLPIDAFSRDRLVIRLDRDLQNLDPAYRIGPLEANILRGVTRRLVKFKPGVVEFENDAASSIRQVDDKLIEFTLKEGMRFQGGYGEVTADDVKFSFERFNQPGPGGKKSTYAKDWDALDGVEVTGKYSGRLVLKRPAPALWLIAIGDGSGCIVSRKAFDALGEKTAVQLHGAGPYALAEWVPNQRIVLRADPNYVGPKPYFQEIVLRPILEGKTAQLAFRSGEIDFTSLEPTEAAEMARDPSAKIIKKDSINYVWIGINVEKKPYDDIRVRHAIQKAIDVDQLILGAYNGTVTRARSLMAPGLLGHWADAPVIKRDLPGAKKLLADAGLPSGFKAKITVLNRPTFQAAAQIAQANLAEIGVDLAIEVLDTGTYYSSGKGDVGKNLELSLQRFGGKLDPGFQTQWFTGEQVGEWNWQRWRNDEFDRLDRIGQSTIDTKAREAAYIRMQQLMADSVAYIWLTHEVNVFAGKTWLRPSILPNGDDWQYEHFLEA